jgi:hypothetical protein
MHLNGSHLDPNAANLYSAVTDRATATKRAAEVRKELMSSTAEVEDELDTGKVLAVEEKPKPEPRRPPARKHPPDETAKNPSDEADEEDPLSIWG